MSTVIYIILFWSVVLNLYLFFFRRSDAEKKLQQQIDNMKGYVKQVDRQQEYNLRAYVKEIEMLREHIDPNVANAIETKAWNQII